MNHAVNAPMRETTLLGDVRFLRRVAERYYDDACSQETIAKLEGCSRMTVSKALIKARAVGILRVSFVSGISRGLLQQMERDLRRKWKLEDAVLVPGGAHPGTARRDEVRDALAVAAGEYLDHVLTSSMVLAVSGGKMIRSVMRWLTPTKRLPGLQVVSMHGFVEARLRDDDANQMASQIAQMYGGIPTWVCAGAWLPTGPHTQREDGTTQMPQMPLLHKAYRLYEQADVFLLGLDGPAQEIPLFKESSDLQALLAALETHHPVTALNHWLFNAEGKWHQSLAPSSSLRAVRVCCSPFTGATVPGTKKSHPCGWWRRRRRTSTPCGIESAARKYCDHRSSHRANHALRR